MRHHDLTAKNPPKPRHPRLGEKQPDLFHHCLRQSPWCKSVCLPETATVIFDAAKHYHHQLRWQVHLLLLMPDHLHALISFPKIESMEKVVRAWKHYLSKQHDIEWQRDYFDHRLRNDESHEEKAAYIRLNPVRTNLVATPGQWPYVWDPSQAYSDSGRDGILVGR